MPPTNNALWYNKPDSASLEIKPAPYPIPKNNEIVVRTRALAINPIDLVLATPMSKNAFPWLKYPSIFGSDVAGEVVEIGPDVRRFRKGDRVMAQPAGVTKERSSAAEGAFQNYVIVLDNMISPIPERLSFEEAAVVPLGLSTAACALFQKDYLALQYPTVPRAESLGQILIVWGGSTSVGANAIQLAVAAGYEVITTASPKNFNFVKRLGASQAFDYNSKTVVVDIINALKNKTIAGALAIGFGSAHSCFDIVSKCKGGKFVATATVDIPDGAGTVSAIYSYMSSEGTKWIKSKRQGIKYKFIFGGDLAFNEVGKAIWEDFLPEALANGSYECAPEPLICGTGLESIEGAMKRYKEGVSVKKVVVSL
jgi:NADPH:quinone reductase-like Zn-dependent oxidoreductase